MLGFQVHADRLPDGFTGGPVGHGEHLGTARGAQEGDASFAGLWGAELEGELGLAGGQTSADAEEGVSPLGLDVQGAFDDRSLAGAVLPAAGEIVRCEGLLRCGRLGEDFSEVGI